MSESKLKERKKEKRKIGREKEERKAIFLTYLRCGLTFINTTLYLHSDSFQSIPTDKLTSARIKGLVATITEHLPGALSTLFTFTNHHNSPIILKLLFLSQRLAQQG